MSQPNSFIRFHPSDKKLIALLCKVKDLPGHRDVIQQDIYRSSPWDLDGGVKDIIYQEKKMLYYFTRRSADGKAGSGVWRDTGQPKPIMGGDGVKGIKKQFVFRDNSKSPMSKLGKWIMDEITITRKNGKFEEFAICKIRIDLPKKNKIKILNGWKSFFRGKELPEEEEEEEEAEAAVKVHDSINMQAAEAEEEAEVEAGAADFRGMLQNDGSGTPNEESSCDLISDDMDVEGCGGEREKPVCEVISVECLSQNVSHLEIDESCVGKSEMPLGPPHLQGDMTDHRSEKEEMQM